MSNQTADGVAEEIEITPEMLTAGLDVYRRADPMNPAPETVAKIYAAMAAKRPR